MKAAQRDRASLYPVEPDPLMVGVHRHCHHACCYQTNKSKYLKPSLMDSFASSCPLELTYERLQLMKSIIMIFFDRMRFPVGWWTVWRTAPVPSPMSSSWEAPGSKPWRPCEVMRGSSRRSWLTRQQACWNERARRGRGGVRGRMPLCMLSSYRPTKPRRYCQLSQLVSTVSNRGWFFGRVVLCKRYQYLFTELFIYRVFHRPPAGCSGY